MGPCSSDVWICTPSASLTPNVVPAVMHADPVCAREIVALLGLDYARYATKETFINRRLCDVRNEIAHGSLVETSEAEYEEVHDGVVWLMDLFRDDVINAASAELFRVRVASPPVAPDAQ
jgi:hypothetical protein